LRQRLAADFARFPTGQILGDRIEILDSALRICRNDGIADRLRILSEEVLVVGESSLYPALQRLLLNGWVKAEWGASENNRRARYYTLTAAGKKRLSAERAEFERLIGAIQRVLHTA
jgi:DNA-binding PadR family transcriptional regulator